jgi:hypothetical protein
MFRSMTIIRELVLSLAKVMLEHLCSYRLCGGVAACLGSGMCVVCHTEWDSVLHNVQSETIKKRQFVLEWCWCWRCRWFSLWILCLYEVWFWSSVYWYTIRYVLRWSVSIDTLLWKTIEVLMFPVGKGVSVFGLGWVIMMCVVPLLIGNCLLVFWR